MHIENLLLKCIAYAKMLMCYIKKFWFWGAILVTNVDLKKIEEAVKMILEAVGEDVNREGLLDTPSRVAKMYEEMFSGLDEDPREFSARFLTKTMMN